MLTFSTFLLVVYTLFERSLICSDYLHCDGNRKIDTESRKRTERVYKRIRNRMDRDDRQEEIEIKPKPR